VNSSTIAVPLVLQFTRDLLGLCWPSQAFACVLAGLDSNSGGGITFTRPLRRKHSCPIHHCDFTVNWSINLFKGNDLIMRIQAPTLPQHFFSCLSVTKVISLHYMNTDVLTCFRHNHEAGCPHGKAKGSAHLCGLCQCFTNFLTADPLLP
jgi:hypothetical protein